MTEDEPEIEVEVDISRPNQGEEIVIAITFPRTATTPKRRLYVSLAPHDFALALTGRSGIKGKYCEFTFRAPKAG